MSGINKSTSASTISKGSQHALLIHDVGARACNRFGCSSESSDHWHLSSIRPRRRRTQPLAVRQLLLHVLGSDHDCDYHQQHHVYLDDYSSNVYHHRGKTSSE